jgi:hypothetical protein
MKIIVILSLLTLYFYESYSKALTKQVDGMKKEVIVIVNLFNR